MKKTILLLVLMMSLSMFSQTDIYRFGAVLVSIDNKAQTPKLGKFTISIKGSNGQATITLSMNDKTLIYKELRKRSLIGDADTSATMHQIKNVLDNGKLADDSVFLMIYHGSKQVAEIQDGRSKVIRFYN